MTRWGAKVSLSPRGIKGHMQLSKYVVELQGGRDSNVRGCFEYRCQSHHPTQSTGMGGAIWTQLEGLGRVCLMWRGKASNRVLLWLPLLYV